jgi:geranylgeranyl reductase family protein
MRGVSRPGRCDVLVLGLGPAGSSAAAAAAKAGLSVIGIDKKSEAGVPVQCAEFVPSLIGQETGDISGSRLQLINDMVTFVEDLAPDHTPGFRGNMISRAEFDRNLVLRAQDAGADCRFGMAVRAIDPDGLVTFADGSTLRGRVLVGADGPHSRAGKAIGQENPECVESRQITVPLLKPHDGTDIFLSADIPGGYGWLFPKQQKANLGLGVSPQYKHLLKPLLESLHRRLVAEGRVGREIDCFTGGAIPVGGMVEPHGMLSGCTVLLCGDAAGLTNPITGAGISSAAMSGAMAGRAAADILAGKANATEDYAEELDDVFGPSLRRAQRHRQRLMKTYATGSKPDEKLLRSTWIAYPDYWAA